jgi:hypothetical protein
MSEQREQQTTETERRPAPGLTNGADTADDDIDTSEAPAPSWRDDWRTALSQGDEKRAKQLERFSTPEAVAKALFDTRERLSRARAAPEPPEGATELELKEWRKGAGIPETPEGYEIAFPKEIEASENDKAELAGFLKFMHDKHVAPRAAQAAFEFYMTSRAQGAERTAQAAEEATLEHLAELRKTYPGREYKRNIGLANDYLNSHFAGPDNQVALDQILSARLPNGVQLTNFAPFVQAIVAMARQNATEDDLISGDAGGGARSVDEEYKELAAKPRLTDAERNRMVQLAEARLKREERGAGR